MALSLGDPKITKARLAILEKEVTRQPLLFARIADIYLEKGKHKKAQKVLERGLSQNPNYSAGWVVQGNLHLALDQRTDALTAFKKALRLDPNNQYAHARCSDLAFEMNSYDDYYYHIISLSLLDMMNGKIRQMVRNEILCRLAVKAGLYSAKEVHRQHPESLARTLRNEGLMPDDVAQDPSIETVELPDFPENYHDSGYVNTSKVSHWQSEPEDEATASVEMEAGEDREEMEAQEPAGLEGDTTFDMEQRVKSMVESLSRTFRGPERTEGAANDAKDASSAAPVGSESSPVEPMKEVMPSVVTDSGMFEIYQEAPAVVEAGKRPIESTPAQVFEIAVSEEAEPQKSVTPIVMEVKSEPEPAQTFRIEKTREEEPEEDEESLPLEEEMPNIKVKLRDNQLSEFPISQEKTSKLQDIQQKSDDDTRKLLAQIAKEVTEGNLASEPETDEAEDSRATKHKRIITRTRAELYASQGEFDEAISMYEDLIVLHPDNQSFRTRIAELQEKRELLKAKEEEKKKRENR